VIKLIYQLAKRICLAFEAPKPKVKPLKVSSLQIKSEIDNMKLRMMYPALLDHYQDYYYLESSQWADVLDYIYFKFDMPPYISARMDCDDFAILLKGLVSSFFGLNAFAVVFGNTPMGYHAFNMFRTEDDWLLFEPQTGDIFEIGERGYTVEWILV